MKKRVKQKPIASSRSDVAKGTPFTLQEIERAKVLSAMGKSFRQIGLELGRNDKTVAKELRRPGVEEEVIRIKGELAQNFEDLAQRFVCSISDADILKESAYRRTLSAGIATDKARLLKGEATAIFDVGEATIGIAQLDAKYKAVCAGLKTLLQQNSERLAEKALMEAGPDEEEE
jgi:hypothetical protein